DPTTRYGPAGDAANLLARGELHPLHREPRVATSRRAQVEEPLPWVRGTHQKRAQGFVRLPGLRGVVVLHRDREEDDGVHVPELIRRSDDVAATEAMGHDRDLVVAGSEVGDRLTDLRDRRGFEVRGDHLAGALAHP